MDSKYYSVDDLTKILKLHRKTILRFIKEKKIGARKIGRSWMISEKELKSYVHGELANKTDLDNSVSYQTLAERIHISAVIEIVEQNSEEASRISNSLMAMLNSMDDSTEKRRFDFFYYPEIGKAKYIVHGSPKFISLIMSSFEVLSQQ
ncbi:MAG: helix-turn-helix domain-containing protein [Candidatus Riflebacteria bacterium]|nr:helix-turn-helix domain-containing protein [Candidatus Riflebacteria bacterium]